MVSFLLKPPFLSVVITDTGASLFSYLLMTWIYEIRVQILCIANKIWYLYYLALQATVSFCWK